MLGPGTSSPTPALLGPAGQTVRDQQIRTGWPVTVLGGDGVGTSTCTRRHRGSLLCSDSSSAFQSPQSWWIMAASLATPLAQSTVPAGSVTEPTRRRTAGRWPIAALLSPWLFLSGSPGPPSPARVDQGPRCGQATEERRVSPDSPWSSSQVLKREPYHVLPIKAERKTLMASL